MVVFVGPGGGGWVRQCGASKGSGFLHSRVPHRTQTSKPPLFACLCLNHPCASDELDPDESEDTEREDELEGHGRSVRTSPEHRGVYPLPAFKDQARFTQPQRRQLAGLAEATEGSGFKEDRDLLVPYLAGSLARAGGTRKRPGALQTGDLSHVREVSKSEGQRE